MSDLYQGANHTSNKEKYWLMVMIAKCPDPVYVGYNAGSVGGKALTAAPVDTTVQVPDASLVTGTYNWAYKNWESQPQHTVLAISEETVAEALAAG